MAWRGEAGAGQTGAIDQNQNTKVLLSRFFLPVLQGAPLPILSRLAAKYHNSPLLWSSRPTSNFRSPCLTYMALPHGMASFSFSTVWCSTKSLVVARQMSRIQVWDWESCKMPMPHASATLRAIPVHAFANTIVLQSSSRHQLSGCRLAVRWPKKPP